MKHDWQILPATAETVFKHGWEPRRQCRNCKVIQQRETQHAWMRVTGYRWLPLAGKCKPKKGTA